MKLYFRILATLITVLAFTSLISCEDEIGYNIPYVFVNISGFDLSEPQNLPFKSGNAIPFDSIYPNSRVGYAGIIIIKGVDISTGYSKYFAFDQCCPVDVEDKHKLVPDGATVYCSEHNVVFSVFDGSGISNSRRVVSPTKTLQNKSKR